MLGGIQRFPIFNVQHIWNRTLSLSTLTWNSSFKNPSHIKGLMFNYKTHTWCCKSMLLKFILSMHILCLCLGKKSRGPKITVTYPACTGTHSPEQLSGIKADSDKLLYIATLSFAFTVLKSLSFLPFLCLLPLRPSLAAGCTSSWIFSDRGQRGNINWQAKPACWDAAHKWNGYK